MSAKGQYNVNTSQRATRRSETTASGGLRLYDAFMARSANFPRAKKEIFRKRNFVSVSPPSTYIYCVLGGLTPHFFIKE